MSGRPESAQSIRRPGRAAVFLNSLRERGVAGSIQRYFSLFLNERHGNRVDREFGIETGGQVHRDDLAATAAEGQDRRGYYGVYPPSLTRALAEIPPPFNQYTFIDIGSGKVRALFLAARQGFRKVIGVEISPALARAAEDNVLKFRQRFPGAPPIRIDVADATQLDLPDGPLVLFMFNPFLGEIFEKTVARIAESVCRNPRPVWLIYSKPLCDEILCANPTVTKVKERRHWLGIQLSHSIYRFNTPAGSAKEDSACTTL